MLLAAHTGLAPILDEVEDVEGRIENPGMSSAECRRLLRMARTFRNSFPRSRVVTSVDLSAVTEFG
jgi:hypothetical protein